MSKSEVRESRSLESRELPNELLSAISGGADGGGTRGGKEFFQFLVAGSLSAGWFVLEIDGF